MTSATLHGVVDSPGERTEAELVAAHAGQLAAVVEAVGADDAVEASGLSPGTVAAVAAGDAGAVGDLDIEEAAALLALVDGAPPAGAIAAEAREDLLLGMTTGVLSVDVVAAEVDVELDPREVQGMVEGRHPMTVEQYAALQRFVASRGR